MASKATTDRGFSSLTAAHEKVCATFLGPQAENHDVLHTNFAAINSGILQARQRFFPKDPIFIDDEIKASPPYRDQVKITEDCLAFLSEWLAKHCIPFFSPRYNGHMVSDASIPSYLGYLVAMLWNQNNVTPEASPLTSHIEYLVGQQICSMLGYRSDASLQNPNIPMGWGHIACGGTVANLESFWYGRQVLFIPSIILGPHGCARYFLARNVKFYPLSLQLAVKEGSLAFIADTFKTTLCNGDTKKLAECSAWELLNLTVDEILDLPTRLIRDYGISTTFLEGAIAKYLIANAGNRGLEERFKIKSPQAMISIANHYSWPKSSSITGVGIDNLIPIRVDPSARLDIQHLIECLEENLKAEQAVFTIVAIMGTTEHGAVDPLLEILEVRKKFMKRGLSFYVHADAAWGGYFTSMLPRRTIIVPGRVPPTEPVIQLPLSEYSEKQLFSIRFADSCTIDPHKAGFIPYPAGCLCYRDERLRFMVTMTAAYINTSADLDTVGTYGVEGSKPGAAPTAVWLAHKAIGLDDKGYGALLGEVLFTSVKFYANWATMDYKQPDLIVKTLVAPQFEQKDIIDTIVNKTNSEILESEEAMKMIKQLGGDLIITVFACNFHIEGKINENITEANFFNRRLFKKFSVTSRHDDPYTTEIIVGSSSLSQKTYGKALDDFKNRLGLKGDGDLTVMTLVPMSPFPTVHQLVNKLADIFKAAALEYIKECRIRIIPAPVHHEFVMQGTDQLFLSSMSVFNIGSYRQQTIITGTLPQDIMAIYVKAVEENPTALFTSVTEKALLSKILSDESCKVSIFQGLNAKTPKCIAKDVDLTNIQVIINRSIAPQHLDTSWPEFMPFYLYGTSSQHHIDHMLLYSPNAQLSSTRIELSPPLVWFGDRPRAFIAIAHTIREEVMQPFRDDHKPTFFAAGSKIPVTIYLDPHAPDASGPGLLQNLGQPVGHTTVTLSSSLYIDYTLVHQECGAAVSQKAEYADNVVFNDIDIPAVGERYNITPGDLASVWNGIVDPESADQYEVRLANKRGWRDELEEALKEKKLARI